MPVLHGQVGLKKIFLAMTELPRGFGLTSFKVQSSKSKVHSPQSTVQSPKFKVLLERRVKNFSCGHLGPLRPLERWKCYQIGGSLPR